MTGRPLKALRKKLGLTQQEFASVLRLSFVSVNKWENGLAKPTELHACLLGMLGRGVEFHGKEVVLEQLRGAKVVGDVVRALVRLERDPSSVRVEHNDALWISKLFVNDFGVAQWWSHEKITDDATGRAYAEEVAKVVRKALLAGPLTERQSR